MRNGIKLRMRAASNPRRHSQKLGPTRGKCRNKHSSAGGESKNKPTSFFFFRSRYTNRSLYAGRLGPIAQRKNALLSFARADLSLVLRSYQLYMQCPSPHRGTTNSDVALLRKEVRGPPLGAVNASGVQRRNQFMDRASVGPQVHW